MYVRPPAFLTMSLVLAAVAGASTTAEAAGTCSASTPENCPTPAVVTGRVVSVTPHGATISGTVNPHGAATTCLFVYGMSLSYGLSTAAVDKGAGSGPVTVTVTISGLQDRTTFHYLLSCSNAGGPAFGTDGTFTTGGGGPSRIAINSALGGVSIFRVGGVFLSCYGDRACIGRLTPSNAFAPAVKYRIGANTTSLVKLSVRAAAFMSFKHGPQRISLSAVDTDGRSARATVTFYF